MGSVPFPLYASCMVFIHHFIGWDAWLLPSSPWQCECPPASHHHGNGSVPQQPSAWAKCKPLNQNHHGNMCLPKRRALVCQWVYLCFYLNAETPTGVGSADTSTPPIWSAVFLISVLLFLCFFFFLLTCNLVIVGRLYYNLCLGLAGIRRLWGLPGPVSEHCRVLTDFYVLSTRDFTIKTVKADKTLRGEGGGALVQKEPCHHSSKDMDTWHTQCHPGKQTP